MTTTEFKSVSDAFSSILGKSAGASLTEQMHQRQIVKALVMLRAAEGLTQQDIAEELDCHQSKVSKLERGLDSDLRIREIEAYAKLAGKDITLLVSERGQNLTQQIKHHSLMIKSAFEELVKLAHQDDGIAGGVAKVYFETFMALNRFLQETSEKLPVCAENGNPYIRIAGGPIEQAAAASSKQQGKSKQIAAESKIASANCEAPEERGMCV